MPKNILEQMSDKMAQDAVVAYQHGYSSTQIAAAFHICYQTYRKIMSAKGFDIDKLSKREPLKYDVVSECWANLDKIGGK